MLETLLQDLTKAINGLTAAIQEAKTLPATEAATPEGKPVAEETRRSSGTTKASEPSSAPADTGEQAKAEAGADEPALTYEKDVAPLFSKLVAANRPAAIEMLEHYKILNQSDAKRMGDVLRPVQYATVIGKCKDLLGEA